MRTVLATAVATIAVVAVIYGIKQPNILRDKLALVTGAQEEAIPKLMVMGRVRGPDGLPINHTSVDLLSATSSTVAPAEIPGQAAAPDVDPTRLLAQAPSTAPPPAGQAQGKPVKVDESALRYFAARNDQARLQAEISRLKALYPDWTPPADPLAVPQNGDAQLEGLWRLYADGRFAELRKAIADRRSVDSAWQPPVDLVERLNVAEARARLVNASDLKQYATVVEIGSQTPALLTCSEVDVLWRIAEAFAQTDRDARAQDAYGYVLKNCADPQERLATVQKASAVLGYAQMQTLLSSEHRNEDGSGEFDSIRDDLSRRFVAEANADAKLQVAAPYVARVEALAEKDGLAFDALLAGWYRLRRDDTGAAEKWFRMAREREDSASSSQGLALCLIARKSPQEAEDVMYRWRDDSSDSKATYMAATANLLAITPPVALQEAVLQRIAGEVIKARDSASAQQFGWYARGFNQPQTAVRWFETALSWKPDDEPSAYGLALSRNQLNDRGGVAALQRDWQGRSARIASLGETPMQTVAAQQMASQAASGNPANSRPMVAPAAPPTPYRPRVADGYASSARTSGPANRASGNARPQRGCVSTVDLEGMAAGTALNLGWCLMELNRPIEAATAFGVALKGGTAQVREEAAYGQSLAYLRSGLTDNAAVSATQAPLTRTRASELQTAILSNRATAAFDAGRYRDALLFLDQRSQLETERVDLMVMRGYAYLNLQRYGDAMRVFEAAAQTGNRDALRGVADVRAARDNDY